MSFTDKQQFLCLKETAKEKEYAIDKAMNLKQLYQRKHKVPLGNGFDNLFALCLQIYRYDTTSLIENNLFLETEYKLSTFFHQSQVCYPWNYIQLKYKEEIKRILKYQKSIFFYIDILGVDGRRGGGSMTVSSIEELMDIPEMKEVNFLKHS